MALSTAQDLIDSALRLLGVVDQEGTPTTNQRNQGLDALNAIIDSLVADRLANYRVDDEQIVLAAASTTWGAAGTINTTRPVKLLAARRVDGAYEYPIRILSMSEYRDLSDKSVTGTLSGLALDPTMTSSQATLYAAGGVGTVKVTSLKPWTQYALVSTSLGLPPGYVRALRHALAVELSPEYQMPAPAVCVSVADKMRSDLANLNAQVQKIVQPMAACGQFDINSGGYLYP